MESEKTQTQIRVLPESPVLDQTTWLELDQNALRHNLAQILSLTFPNAQIMAVVKANAYGHGLLEVAQCLRNKVSYFGVASIEEALVLRNAGIGTPILLFGVPMGGAIEKAIRAEVSLAVSSVEQAREISDEAQRLKKPAVIHIKVDTGMGRLGIPKSSAVPAIAKIASLEMLQLEGLFTHFPQAEEIADPFTGGQIRIFNQILEESAEKEIQFPYCHAANSTGVVNHPEAHFNLVRPGLSLYGIYPHSSLKPKLPLKPVLSLRARVILVKKLARGESAGYGRTFTADSETVIGIVPVGYSHGYPFSLSNKGTVLFRGKSYPVVGRVSMDYIAVNFGPYFSAVRAGAVVTLLGRDGESEISAETLAEKAGTIPYELE